MWNAFEEIQGWSIGKVYEVSHVGSNSFKDAAKGQLISKGNFCVFKSTKKPMKIIFPISAQAFKKWSNKKNMATILC